VLVTVCHLETLRGDGLIRRGVPSVESMLAGFEKARMGRGAASVMK
jgi:hypothetical protein